MEENTPELLGTFGLLFGGALLYFFYAYARSRRRSRKLFDEEARLYDLTAEERGLLWRYLIRLPVEPTEVFKSRPLFERVLQLAAENGSYDELLLLTSLRHKLRYENKPWFIPLSGPHELDPYQPGVLLSGGRKVPAFVLSADAEELELKLPDGHGLKRGDEASFFFLREEDGRYTVKGVVKEVSNEYLRLKKEAFERVQLREAPRWKVKAEVKVKSPSGLEITGRLENVSVKGARICYPSDYSFKEGEIIFLEFELKGERFENLKARVVYEQPRNGERCAGVEFLELKRSERELIEAFIREELEKLRASYKKERKDG